MRPPLLASGFCLLALMCAVPFAATAAEAPTSAGETKPASAGDAPPASDATTKSADVKPAETKVEPTATSTPEKPKEAKKSSGKPAVLPIVFAAEENALTYSGRVAGLLDAAIKKSGQYELVDPKTRFDQLGEELRKEKRDCGYNALEFGKKQYIEVDEGMGSDSFARAVSCFEESALWEDFKGLSQSIAMQLLVRWSIDPGGTRKEIARLLSMDPTVEWPKDKDLTPPADMQVEIQRARDAAKYETKVSLDITTKPVSARIYVDGKYKGMSPMSVKELNQGDHYLSIVAPGYEVVQKLVRVTPASTMTVELKPTKGGEALLRFTDAIRKEFRQESERTKVKLLGSSTGAQYVIVGRVQRTAGQISVDLHRIRTKDSHVAAEVEIKDLAESATDFDKVITQQLAGLFQADRPLKKNGQTESFREPPPKPTCDSACSFKRAKIATGISGAALFVGGVATGILARTKANEFRGIPQSDPKFNSTRDNVRTLAITADVLMGVGLAAGLAWGTMQFGVKKYNLPDPKIQEKDETPEEGKEREERKPSKTEEDPFASVTPERSIPELFALPLPGGLTFGVQGSF